VIRLIGLPLRRDIIDLTDYFSAIKDEDLLRGLEEDSEKIRGSGRHEPQL